MSIAEHPDTEVVEAEAHVRRLNKLASLGVAAAVIVLATYAIKFFGPLSDKPERWGQFGDYVGGLLNPTFSLLALLALLATLGLQIRELRLSVRELRNSAAALVKQNDTLKLQAFEGTFFQLLRLHNDIVTSMEVIHLSLKGRKCFEYYLSMFEDQLANGDGLSDLETATLIYEFFYRKNQAVLGHYFRLLYNIIKLVKQTDGMNQRFYTNLVQAQLSSAELKLLFYNCLSSFGSEKFKPLVEEFALLKTIPDDTLPAEKLLHAYSPSAFGGAYPESWL